MEIFGLSITRRKHAAPNPDLITSVPGRGGWHRIYESFAGAWQRNIEVQPESVLTYSAVFACVTLIASDIGKVRIKLTKAEAGGVWTETSGAYSGLLER